jgi:hypothetical protein
MTWLGRLREGRGDRGAEVSVASDLAEFLVRATEENALREAIDAGMHDLGQAGAESADAPRSAADATQWVEPERWVETTKGERSSERGKE